MGVKKGITDDLKAVFYGFAYKWQKGRKKLGTTGLWADEESHRCKGKSKWRGKMGDGPSLPSRNKKQRGV